MAQLWWGDDNTTLHFGEVKLPEAIAAAEKTQYLYGGVTPDITFDLSRLSSAFAPQLLPLVIVSRRLHTRGVSVRLVLPDTESIARLFVNAGWAHLIAPQTYPETDFSGHHLPATTYRSATEQQQVVTAITDLLLEEAHIDRDVLGALEWSLNETTDNVLTHADDPTGGIVQVTRYDKVAHIVVCDAGQGIGPSMREAFPKLDTDLLAVEQAVLPGVTSGAGQGNGLAGICSIARLAEGEVSILSGRAYANLRYVGHDVREHWQPVIEDINFPGTAVTLSLPLDVQLDLREALRFQNPDWEPFDLIDARYETGDIRGEFQIRLANERRGVGSREAGRALRNKAENLLATSPSARLVIDLEGVGMIASSFADEAIGKLRAIMGPGEFDRRVALTGFSDPVQAVIAGAVSQRMRTSGTAPSDARARTEPA